MNEGDLIFFHNITSSYLLCEERSEKYQNYGKLCPAKCNGVWIIFIRILPSLNPLPPPKFFCPTHRD